MFPNLISLILSSAIVPPQSVSSKSTKIAFFLWLTHAVPTFFNKVIFPGTQCLSAFLMGFAENAFGMFALQRSTFCFCGILFFPVFFDFWASNSIEKSEKSTFDDQISRFGPPTSFLALRDPDLAQSGVDFGPPNDLPGPSGSAPGPPGAIRTPSGGRSGSDLGPNCSPKCGLGPPTGAQGPSKDPPGADMGSN